METIIYNPSLRAWVKVESNKVVKEKELKPVVNDKPKQRGNNKNSSNRK